jgi:hypothetical protein
MVSYISYENESIWNDKGIWFEEEDPSSELYNVNYCRNVYIDYVMGVFDKYSSLNDNHYDNYDYDDYDDYHNYDDYYDDEYYFADDEMD